MPRKPPAEPIDHHYNIPRLNRAFFGAGALLTAVFLLGAGIRFASVIIVFTFLCGLLPVIGNLISNTLIVCVALTVSPNLALLEVGTTINPAAFSAGNHRQTRFFRSDPVCRQYTYGKAGSLCE